MFMEERGSKGAQRTRPSQHLPWASGSIPSSRWLLSAHFPVTGAYETRYPFPEVFRQTLTLTGASEAPALSAASRLQSGLGHCVHFPGLP